MWREKLKEIIEEKGLYGETVNRGAAEEELQLCLEESADELKVDLPEEYRNILREINGIEFNGFILYGIDEKLLKLPQNQHIYGLIEMNRIWYENEWQKQYLFLGESSIGWYVYDLASKKYCELDNPSGRMMEEYGSCGSMLEKMLTDSLL